MDRLVNTFSQNPSSFAEGFWYIKNPELTGEKGERSVVKNVHDELRGKTSCVDEARVFGSPKGRVLTFEIELIARAHEMPALPTAIRTHSQIGVEVELGIRHGEYARTDIATIADDTAVLSEVVQSFVHNGTHFRMFGDDSDRARHEFDADVSREIEAVDKDLRGRRTIPDELDVELRRHASDADAILKRDIETDRRVRDAAIDDSRVEMKVPEAGGEPLGDGAFA